MISPAGGLRVYVATRPTDFRNYVGTIIMRSRVHRLFDCGFFTDG